MIYLTKDKTGLIQLWNNKPEYNKYGEFFMAWIEKGVNNEVAIEVNKNTVFYQLFVSALEKTGKLLDTPCMIEIDIAKAPKFFTSFDS